MATAISPDLYPHIWDEIIACADRSTQHTLRRVNTVLRTLVDRYQVRHVILTPVRLYSARVSRPGGKIAAFAHPGQFWADERLVDLLAWTRVVDVRGFCPPTLDMPQLAPAFQNLEVVRLGPDTSPRTRNPGSTTPYVPWSARTLVLFAHREGVWANRRHWWWNVEIDPETEAWRLEDGKRAAVPRGVNQSLLFRGYERLVLNFNGGHAMFTEIWPFLANLPATVKEVVLVIPRNTSLWDSGTMSALNESAFVTEVAALVRARHVRYTIVGCEVYQRRLGSAGTKRGELRARMLQAFIDADGESDCADTREGRETGRLDRDPVPTDPMDFEQKCDELMANIEFLTQQEYRMRVDDERAKVETLEFFRQGD